MIHTELATWRLRDLGLTYAEAGKIAGLSASTVSRIVNRQGNPDPEDLERFVVAALRMPLALATVDVAPDHPDHPDKQAARA